MAAHYSASLNAQVVINEIYAEGTVELKNNGTDAVDVSTYWLCDFPVYEQIQNSNILCGSMILDPGEILVVNDFNTINNNDGEMGLYTSSNFASSNNIIDYVEWGFAGHTRANVAIAANIWSDGDFVPAFGAGESLSFDGSGETASDWTATSAPTICSENGGGGCIADGGAITFSDGSTTASICVDGNADPLNTVFTTDATGTNMGYVITDADNNILGLPAGPPFDLDGAGEGTCIIWAIAYEDDFSGATVGENVSDLTGCFDLSNGLTVYREAPDGGTVSLIDGSTFYSATAGNVVVEVQHTTNAPNLSFWYIITDINDNILGFANSANGNTLDLSGAPVGECHIWGWSYRGLNDPVMGDHISSLTDDDCEAISQNFIRVNRQPADCEVVVGDIALADGSTSTSICVDGNGDPLEVVTSGGTSGVSTGWIITDANGNILALPAGPPFDLDGAGVGICEIWYLRYEDDGNFGGKVVGNNITDLTGCYAISNPIDVIREAPDGGIVSLIDGSTFYSATAGNVVVEVQHTTNAPNLSFWYIIADINDNILGFANSANGNTLDLSGAPVGECHIWGWSYRGLNDPVMGDHISSLTDDDCEAISQNFIRVNRQPTDCEVVVGDIALADGSTSTSICVDGNGDPLEVVTSGGTPGVATGWIITDADGNILALPAGPPFDLDGAGVGICEIWYLRYEDDGNFGGKVVGNNITDLTGCYAISNPIDVIREAPDGGIVTLLDGSTSYTNCAGNIVFDVTHTTASPNLSYWYIITDANDNILAWVNSANSNTLDLSGAPAGECHVWGWNYRGLNDPIIGDHISTLADDDCEDISDEWITVFRETAVGGTLEGGPYAFCVGDGIPDNIPSGDITLSGNSGTNNQWVVTDDQGNILGLPPMPSVVNFDGAGAGTCLIWNIAYSDGLQGLVMGENVDNLSGCYNFSNAITVERSQPEGGTLEGGPFVFCVGDGIEDNIPAGSITLSGNVGTNNRWVVTDDQGNILGLPPMPSVVNFDGAGTGTCLIWNIAYEDGLEGLAMGENVSGLIGCYSFSNSITVLRSQADGGTLDGGPYAFCVGDGIEDNIPDGDITLSGNSGTNNQWVITDDQGNILGLPPTPYVVNFDGAGPGTCLIWNIAYEDGLQGLAMGENVDNLSGCYNFSNSIAVVRSQPEGGMLDGGPYAFCVGDGMSDNIPDGDITLSGNSGANNQWVITDDQGNILGLPPSPYVVNFDGAGPGTCLIWNIAYADGLQGLAMGENVDNLSGCYNFSNSIAVIRSQPEGGTLDGGPYAFCVGDGMADNIPDGNITLSGNSGTNNRWVITDDQGNILGLPPTPYVVNFDGAGPGTCLIWNIAYADGLQGLAMGENVDNLSGCYNFSNSIAVVRSQPEGGTLDGGPYAFCVGDGMADNIPDGDITLSGNSGTNNRWVITDDQGNILGLPPTPYVVNFDGAGPGTCLIWNIAYADGLQGLAMGENVDNLSGCYNFSNSIAVVRSQPEGGTLDGGPYTFTVGDGIADNIPDGDIMLSGNSGSNSQWVITDDQGNILGLPPTPYVVNFDGAGPGTCLVWHLSYEDGLQGLEAGLNAADFSGCYSLSNPIEVIRTETGGTGIDLNLRIDVESSTYGIYERVPYTIYVTNEGSETATGVVVSAGLPDGMVHSDDEVSQGEYSLYHEEWRVGSLEPGESAYLELTLFTKIEGVDIINYVQVIEADQDDVDSTPDNNDGPIPVEDDEAAVTISEFGGTGPGSIDLELEIAVDSDVYDIYENVLYTITVTNNGIDPATDITIHAGLPDGMVHTEDDVSAGDYNLYFETWSLDYLAPGQSEILELELFTRVDDVSITNFVEVISVNENDVDSSPGNGNGVTPQEDDEAAITIEFDDSQSIVINAPSNNINRNIEAIGSIYPNPANSIINVDFELKADLELEIQIFDLGGRLFKSIPTTLNKGFQQVTLNINDLAPGSYFVKTSNEAGILSTKRFVKID